MSGKFKVCLIVNPSQIQRHINGYLDHLLVERGLAKNSMSAYRRDLARYQEFLVSRGDRGIFKRYSK
jgi:integrase/recombinase XerD